MLLPRMSVQHWCRSTSRASGPGTSASRLMKWRRSRSVLPRRKRDSRRWRLHDHERVYASRVDGVVTRPRRRDAGQRPQEGALALPHHRRGPDQCLVSRRPVVWRRLHAIFMNRLPERRRWVVSFRTVSIRAGAPHQERAGAVVEDRKVIENRKQITSHRNTSPEQFTRALGFTQLPTARCVCVGGTF